MCWGEIIGNPPFPFLFSIGRKQFLRFTGREDSILDFFIATATFPARTSATLFVKGEFGALTDWAVISVPFL
jgi:hypothetical protein